MQVLGQSKGRFTLMWVEEECITYAKILKFVVRGIVVIILSDLLCNQDLFSMCFLKYRHQNWTYGSSLMQATGIILPLYAYSVFLPPYLFCDQINSQSQSTTVEKLRLCWVYTVTQKTFSWSFRTQTSILQLVVPKYKALHSALSQCM